MVDKERFKTIKKLYHYTSLSSAVKIIEGMSLKFGSLQRMNDINERYKRKYVSNKENDFYVTIKDLENELLNIKQISLTQDTKKHYGFDIPAMWGHYAERGEGVCFVFDKEKIINEVKNNKYKSSRILYKDTCNDIFYEDEYTVKDFFCNNLKSLFFTKTKDWSYEQEYRILNMKNTNDELFLDVKDALLAIIICNVSDEHYTTTTKYKILSSITNIPILEYSNTNLFGLKLADSNMEEWFGDSLGINNFEIDV